MQCEMFTATTLKQKFNHHNGLAKYLHTHNSLDSMPKWWSLFLSISMELRNLNFCLKVKLSIASTITTLTNLVMFSHSLNWNRSLKDAVLIPMTSWKQIRQGHCRTFQMQLPRTISWSGNTTRRRVLWRRQRPIV